MLRTGIAVRRTRLGLLISSMLIQFVAAPRAGYPDTSSQLRWERHPDGTWHRVSLKSTWQQKSSSSRRQLTLGATCTIGSTSCGAGLECACSTTATGRRLFGVPATTCTCTVAPSPPPPPSPLPSPPPPSPSPPVAWTLYSSCSYCMGGGLGWSTATSLTECQSRASAGYPYITWKEGQQNCKVSPASQCAGGQDSSTGHGCYKPTTVGSCSGCGCALQCGDTTTASAGDVYFNAALA